MSANGDVPMYKKTPNRTGIGMYVKMGARKSERTITTEINMSVTRCALLRGKKIINGYDDKNPY